MEFYMNNNFLLEIFCEDLPPSYLKSSIDQLERFFENLFISFNLKKDKITVFYTPRRLIIMVENLQERQNDSEKEIKGPPYKIAYIDNKPTKALLGFLKKNNIQIENTYKLTTEKGVFIACKKIIKGGKTIDILSENIPLIIEKINFPKKMKWEKTNFKFARPIRNIAALYNNEIIDFTIAGVKSNNKILIDRFNKNSFLEITCDTYISKLKENQIIFDQKKRKNKIEDLLEKQADIFSGNIIEDNDLLEEVTNLVENPILIMGEFDKKYLTLPDEIIITALKHHQRDFSIRDKDNKLLPYFIYIADGIDISSKETVKNGNEKIVNSRIEDAFFYYNEDTKINFCNHFPALSNITYRNGIGTLKDKTDRLIELTLFIKDSINIDLDIKILKRAAYLSKIDMASLMIRDGKEFTSLQGTIGKYYALASGENKEVSIAIEDQYKPDIFKKKFPKTMIGSVLSIADKLDHLVGFISIIGLPKGSTDPYGIKRATNLLIELLLENKWNFNLTNAVDFSYKLYQNQGFLKENNCLMEIKNYCKSRIINILRSKDYRYDIVNSSVNIKYLNALKSYKITESLSIFRENKEFLNLILSFNRAFNILKSENFDNNIDKNLFESKYEKKLYNSYIQIKEKIYTNIAESNFLSALKILIEIKKPLDNFFDNIMVNVKNENLKNNRKTLLYKIIEIFDLVADFRKIVVEGDEKK